MRAAGGVRVVRANLEARHDFGQGAERPRLQALAASLGIRESVRMPGAEANPYRYMARARLLVLSSAWGQDFRRSCWRR